MKILTEFEKGSKIKIKQMECGWGSKRRLADLGLFTGAEIELIKNDRFGPLLIKILDSKIALGRGESQKIYGEKRFKITCFWNILYL